MRLTHLIAVLLAVLGAAIVTPAAASTSLSKPAPVVSPFAQPGSTTIETNQYRYRRYGYRYGYRPRYYRPRIVYRRYYYRPRYYRPRYYRPRHYRRWR